jgi:glutaredoxin 3
MKRKIEVFTSGCPRCDDAVQMVREIACPSCEVTEYEIASAAEVARAVAIGVRSTPAVVIDGELAACCADGRPDAATLKAAGLGQPL